MTLRLYGGSHSRFRHYIEGNKFFSQERLENVKVEKDFWLPAPGPQEIVHRKEICRVKINISDRRRERRQAEKKQEKLFLFLLLRVKRKRD